MTKEVQGPQSKSKNGRGWMFPLKRGDLAWAGRRVVRRAILRASSFMPAWIYQEFVFLFGAILTKILRAPGHAPRAISKVLAARDSLEIEDLNRSNRRFLHRSKLIRILSWGLRFNRSDQWTIQGIEHLDGVIEEGRGVILASAHIGHPRLIGPILCAHGYPVMQVVAEGRRDLVRKVRWERWRAGKDWVRRPVVKSCLRLLLDYDDIGAGLDIRPILAALSRNEPVMIVADGVKTRETVGVPLMGRAYPFAKGFMKIAMLTGAPVLPVFVVEARDGRRVRLEIHPPLQIDSNVSVEENVNALGRIVGRQLEKTPHQWYRWERLARSDAIPAGEEESQKDLDFDVTASGQY